MNTGHILIMASAAVFIAAMFAPDRGLASFHAILAFAGMLWGVWLGNRADKFRVVMAQFAEWKKGQG